MNYKVATVMLFFAISLFSTIAIAQDETLTNADVISLSNEGFGMPFIIQRIKASKTNFDTRIPRLVELKKAGVAEEVISEMVNAKSTSVAENVEPKKEVAEAEPAKVIPAGKKSPISGIVLINRGGKQEKIL